MSNEPIHLKIDSLGLTLGSFKLRDINLEIAKGEYHILLGPTGSGKSSLVKCVLGFITAQNGRIFLKGEDITSKLPEQRNMGYLPQSYALFPHLNTQENIRFGMKVLGRPKSESDSRVKELLDMLGITKLKNRSILNLSGGEKQKVALARALAVRPETVLLDEPFSSVDESSKRALWFELKNAVKEMGITAIHITHNLEEAETLGEKVSVMIDGALAQSGDRKQVFEQPKSENIARFLAYRNIFEGTAFPDKEGTRVNMGRYCIFVKEQLESGSTVKLCIRQQDIKIIKPDAPIKDQLKRNVFNGQIVGLFPMIDHCLMWFQIEGSDKKHDFEIRFPRHIMERYNLHLGDNIAAALWEPKIVVL